MALGGGGWNWPQPAASAEAGADKLLGGWGGRHVSVSRSGHRAPLYLQVKFSIHVPQGVTGQAGNQLTGPGHPGPEDLLPLHGGTWPDLPMGERGEM